MDETEINLTIHTIMGTEIKITTSNTETIDDICLEIWFKSFINIREENINLIYNNKLLDKNTTVGENGLTETSKLYLAITMYSGFRPFN
jgi:hypothetical protein